MAAKKMKKNPAAIAARVEGRKKFVGEARKKGVDAKTARKRYYVKTRSSEMTAAGKKVDKAALRKKFESGGVTREGFYAPGDKKRGKGKSTKSGSNMPKGNYGDAARRRNATGFSGRSGR
jgi:hypothetical protein